MDWLGAIWSFFGRNAVELSTAATALFTGVMAWIAWRQSRARLIAEWNFDYPHTNPFFVRITIRNGLPHSIKPSRIRASKRFVADIQPNGKDRKHSSWAANECPVTAMNAIEPGHSGHMSFAVSVDWQAARRQQQRWHSRLRTWFAKVAWKLLSARVHHGASVHFQVTIDSNVSTSFRKRIKAKIRIPLVAAERNITATAKAGNQS